MDSVKNAFNGPAVREKTGNEVGVGVADWEIS